MKTELKCNKKIVLKCEENKNRNLFISTLFDMQMSTDSTVKNSLSAIKSLWKICDKTGVLSRRDTLVNQSKEQINVSRALASFTFAPGHYEVYSETSEWCCENQGKWQDVTTDGITLKHKGCRTTEGGTAKKE